MGISIEQLKCKCNDELRIINVAMAVVEKLTYMWNLTKLLDHDF